MTLPISTTQQRNPGEDRIRAEGSMSARWARAYPPVTHLPPYEVVGQTQKLGQWGAVLSQNGD
eukprot:4258343-Heterocapsa_arctica.AAC.1